MASLQPATTAAIDALREATLRLQAAVDKAIDIGGANTMAAPSRLPDWTIGHVVSHLARNADGLRRVLLGAQSAKQVQPYDSAQARVNDIQAGAERDTETIAADLRTASQQLATTIDEVAAETWRFTVDLGRGGPTTADVILAARLGEVELHHQDLGVDDGLDLLDDAQANRLLAALMRSYVRTRDVQGLTLIPDGADTIRIREGGPEVAGAAIELVRWLSGRSDGSGLRTAGPFPYYPRGEYRGRHEQRREPVTDKRLGRGAGDVAGLVAVRAKQAHRQLFRTRRATGRARVQGAGRHHHHQTVRRPDG